MSMLAKIQRGRQTMPPRVLLYGTEGIGKSTFGSQAPKPIFIQTEDGLDEIDTDKFPLATSYDQVVAALADLRREQHDYESVVIDSLDWLERLVFDRLCAEHNAPSIEQVAGGYSKGYTLALNFWREIIANLNALRNERGMVVLLIAHSKGRAVRGPRVEPLRPLLAAPAQARGGASERMVRRRAVRHAEDSHPVRRRRLQP